MTPCAARLSRRALMVLGLLVWACAVRGDDPLPLQRVVLPPERIAAELDKVKRGILVQLPRGDFEAKVQAAAQAVKAGRQPPRLVRATYAAELVDQALAGGRGEWTVVHAGEAAGLLPLPSLNLALHQARWEHGAPVVLGELDGQQLGLLVERSGRTSCLFDWSLRGQPASGALTFDMQLPACPITLLELKLPADHWLVLRERQGILVSGPHDGGQPSLQLWRLQITGRCQLQFEVRQLEDERQSPRLFAQLQGRQALTPARVLADWDVQVEALQGNPRELVFEGDAELEPYEVTARGGEVLGWHWQTQPAPRDAEAKEAPSRLLTVKLREPLRGTLAGLRIRCLAPRPLVQGWSSPSLRLRHAVARTETLRLHVIPDLQLGTWDPGDFRLTGAETESDGAHILTLTSLRNDGPAARRPQVELRAQETDLRTRQRTRWHLGDDGMELTTEVVFDLARGTLHRLALKLPAAAQRFQVETVELTPREQLRSWVIAGPLLLVDLQRGLTPRSAATLKVRLRAPQVGFVDRPRVVAFPEVEPTDAVVREGTLEITAAPVLQTQLLKSSQSPGRPPAPESGGAGLPCYGFVYRGAAVAGQLRIVPQRARIRLRCEEEVVLDPRAGRLRARLQLEPVVGQLDAFDLVLSAPVATLTVRSEDPQVAVRQLRRLPLAEVAPELLRLTASPGLVQAALSVGLPRGQVWRLELGERLQKTTTLTVEATFAAADTEALLRRLPLPLTAGDPWALLIQVGAGPLPEAGAERRWPIPVLSGRDVDELDGELQVRSTELRIVAARPAGFEGQTAPRAAHADQRYTYRAAGSGPELTVWTRAEERLPAGEAICDQARLTTTIDGDGRALHHLSFRLCNWPQATCPVEVAAQRVLGARVDGHWVSAAAAGGARQRLWLPVSSGRGCHIEVVYESAAASAAFGSWAFTAAEPVLPAPHMGLDRRWRLPSGLWPLQPEQLRAGHGSAGVASWRDLWELGAAPVEALWGGRGEDQLAAQRQRVLGAEAGLRPALKPQTRLHEALERLDLDLLRDAAPLVVDQQALVDAGIHPDQPLGVLPPAGQPAWDGLGLAYVACPRGGLLSTARQLKLWQEQGLDAADVALLVGAAVEEALEHGVDSSGSYVTLARWLRYAPALGRRAAESQAAALFGGGGEGWSEWYSLPGLATAEQLRVVATAPALALGWALAAGMLLLLWPIRRLLSPRGGLRLHVILLGVLGVTALAVPATLRNLVAAPPFLAALVALVGFLNWPPGMRAGARASRSTMIRRNSSIGLFLLVLPAVPWLVHAQTATSPAWVFLVDAGGAKGSVLVPPELMKQLQELVEHVPLARSGAVLVGARYQLQIDGQSAAGEAEFEVHNFQEQGELAVPLSGVQLREGAFLDGAPVFPVADKQATGFVQPVRGKGRHLLRLAFSARAQVSGEQHELGFGIPRLPQSELKVAWVGATSGHDVQCQGTERIVVDSKRPHAEMQAQLGAEGSCKLRWLGRAGAAADKLIEVQEGYFWDLRPGSGALSAVLQYSIARGSVTRLALQLAAEHEVRAVDVTGAAGPVVTAWRVAGKEGQQRQLQIDFARPTAGGLTCHIEILPRLALTGAEAMLRLPLPLGARTTDGFVGYRLEGLEAGDRAQSLAVTGLAPDRFSKAWSKLAGREAPAITRGFSFRRTGPQAALGLALQAARPHAELDTSWFVRAQYAELTAKVALTAAAGADIILVQARVPKGVKLVDVQSDKVHHWHLQETLLQVWLTQPRKQVALEITGWVALPAPAARRRFVPPALELIQVQAAPARLRLRGDTGIQLAEEQLKNATRLSGEAGLAYETTAGAETAFTLSAQPALPEGRVLTTVQRRQDELEVHGFVHLAVPPDLPVLQFAVDGWSGAALRLDVAAPVVQRTRTVTGQRHEWRLVFARGLPAQVRLAFHGRITVAPDRVVPLPAVALAPGRLTDAWVLLHDLGQAAPAAEARAAKSLPESWLFGPAAEVALEAGTLWQLDTPARRAEVRVPALAPASAAKVLLAEQEAALVGPGRWLHEARYLVQAQGKSELRLALPAGARLLATAVDGWPVSPGSHVAGELALALPDSPRASLLQVRWDYPGQRDPATPPDRTPPRVIGAEVLARQAQLYLPADLRRDEPALTLAEAEQLLARAQAQLRSTLLMAASPEQNASGALLATQQRFYSTLRYLEKTLAWHRTGPGGEDAAPLQRRAVELRQENVAAAGQHNYEALRKRAEATPWAAPPDRLGFAPLPASPPFAFDGAAPRLDSVFDAAAAETRILGELLLLACLSLLLMSYLRQGLLVVQLMWPLVVVVLVGAGTIAWGVTPVAVLVLLAAASTWFVLAWRRLRAAYLRWLQRRTQEPSVHHA